MDRDKLASLIQAGPVSIVTNDGSSHLIVDSTDAIVSDIAVHYLHRDKKDDKLRANLLPLTKISSVQSLVSSDS